MPDPRRVRCGCCGKHTSEVGSISWEGNCLPCAKLLLIENVVGITTKSGPAHRRWLRGIIRAAERDLTTLPTITR